MILKKWEDIPDFLQINEVKPYYDLLINKKASLIIKRFLDFFISLLSLIILFPLFIIIAFIIKFDSKGPVFYRQERVTQYGRIFKIYKFRSMIVNADKGSLITSSDDSRITKIGHILRKTKIDELPQLINVLFGDMTFVGTRPEVVKYVNEYTNEMKATLLLPAGITSLASINYCNENDLLDNENIEKVYINEILPEKMKWNLKELKEFNIINDIKVLFSTIFTVL